MLSILAAYSGCLFRWSHLFWARIISRIDDIILAAYSGCLFWMPILDNILAPYCNWLFCWDKTCTRDFIFWVGDWQCDSQLIGCVSTILHEFLYWEIFTPSVMEINSTKIGFFTCVGNRFLYWGCTNSTHFGSFFYL